MRYWVGVTDKDWFHYLAERAPDEVNFWQPSARRLAEFLQPGVPFLFKLHAPDNYIVFTTLFRITWQQIMVVARGVAPQEEVKL